MPWQVLDAFRDPAIPKLDNLRRAARRGLCVPSWTLWARADEPVAELAASWPKWAAPVPWVVRSASPTEDTRQTSNAGQLLSLVVREPAAFTSVLTRVIAALPRNDGRPMGAIFVQPLVLAKTAGITFFDGFYFEETRASENNMALTSGAERGEVDRGHVQRGDRHHAWLLRVHRLFGGCLDIEWARPESDGDPVLLQVRPALFPIRRCETLSLANHKEILGDPPSPWMVGVLGAVARPAMRFFEAVDPAIATWEEPYAIELAERGWLNFSAFFRMMDRWGLPRTMVTEGVGGESDGPADHRIILWRLIRSSPTLIRLGLSCLAQIARIGRGLRALDAELDRAETLLDLYRASARALDFSVRTNFAIISLLSVFAKLRKMLGLGQAAHVVTQAMMAEYAELAARPELADRLLGLEHWLERYGHRGPLESDPRRPRFAELREVLQADLARGPAPPPPPRPRPAPWLATLSHPLFVADEIRERFRDSLMRRWQLLRTRILAEARRAVMQGHLNDPDDAFFLRGEDLAADPATWRARATERRALRKKAERLDLPATAPRDVIEAAVARAEHSGAAPCPDRFLGIGLGRLPVTGTAVRADDLPGVLAGEALPESAILVVETLEPSWAVVFPRFSAVVAELGGELSHASILLREAGISAVVNARGAYQSIADGDLIAVDPSRGEVRVEERRAVIEAAS